MKIWRTIGIGILFIALAGALLTYQKPTAVDQLATPIESKIAQVATAPQTVPLSLVTQPEGGVGFLLQKIAQAQTSIDLVIYQLKDPDIQDALVAAQKRGVAVRVILDQSNLFGRHPNQAAFDFLQKNKVPVKWSPDYFGITHQKTFIFDDKQAVIMTFNLTPQYYGSSRDFAVINNDLFDVGAIADTFSSDWNNSQMPASDGNDLIWSPGSAPALLGLINSTQNNLDIYSQEMQDPRIIAALKAAAERGVAVRVLMTYATNWKEPLSDLVTAGVGVHTFTSSAKLYIHAKVIISDNTLAFIGSENFSDQSLDGNRELGIFVSKKEILHDLEKTFALDWSNAKPFTPSPTTPSISSLGDSVVKESSGGVCHPPNSAYYNTVTHYTSFPTLDACLTAGGRLPANYKK